MFGRFGIRPYLQEKVRVDARLDRVALPCSSLQPNDVHASSLPDDRGPAYVREMIGPSDLSKRPEFFPRPGAGGRDGTIFTNATLAQTATSRPPAGPPSVADLAEGLLDAVVNISISQNVKSDDNAPMPQVPEGRAASGVLRRVFQRTRRPRAVGRARFNSLVRDSSSIRLAT